MPLDDLLGPQGVAIGAVALVILLGRLHLAQDARDRADAAEWRRLYFELKDDHEQVVEADERHAGIT